MARGPSGAGEAEAPADGLKERTWGGLGDYTEGSGSRRRAPGARPGLHGDVRFPVHVPYLDHWMGGTLRAGDGVTGEMGGALRGRRELGTHKGRVPRGQDRWGRGSEWRKTPAAGL